MENFNIKDVISDYYYEKVKKKINEETLNYYYDILKNKDFNFKDLNTWLNNNFIIRIRRKKEIIKVKKDTEKLYIKDLLREKYNFHFDKEINEDTLIYYYNILKPKDFSREDFNKFIDNEFSNNKNNKFKNLEKEKKEKEKIKRINFRKKENKIVDENKITIKDEIIKKIKKIKKEEIKNVKCKVFLLLPIFKNSENCIEIIKNVINQKFKDWNMLVINSTNNYNDNIFIEYFMNKEYQNIKYIKNYGNISENLNLGIDYFFASNCNFFIRLKDNYIYNTNFLEEICKNKNEFTYSYWKNDFCVMEKKYEKFTDLLNWSNIGLFMISKKYLEKIGKFKNIEYFEDYDLLLRTYLILKSKEINCCEKFLVENILNFNNNKIDKIKQESYKTSITKFYNFIYYNNIDILKLTLFNYNYKKLDFNLKSYILKLPPDYHILND